MFVLDLKTFIGPTKIVSVLVNRKDSNGEDHRCRSETISTQIFETVIVCLDKIHREGELSSKIYFLSLRKRFPYTERGRERGRECDGPRRGVSPQVKRSMTSFTVRVERVGR